MQIQLDDACDVMTKIKEQCSEKCQFVIDNLKKESVMICAGRMTIWILTLLQRESGDGGIGGDGGVVIALAVVVVVVVVVLLNLCCCCNGGDDGVAVMVVVVELLLFFLLNCSIMLFCIRFFF